MVGLGTQDSLPDGRRFAQVHGVTFPLLWEDAFESWSGFEITRQPASILVSPDGQELKRVQGALRQSDYDEILRTIGPS